MTKNERIQYLEDELADLKERVKYLETKPEPYNPWTPIGPGPTYGNGYTCSICKSWVGFGIGHYCGGSGWFNTSPTLGSVH